MSFHVCLPSMGLLTPTWWEQSVCSISLDYPIIKPLTLGVLKWVNTDQHLSESLYVGLLVQRGVDLPSLDVTYFTSLSYYILLLFGLRGVLMLFFRDEVIDETHMMRQQMNMGNPMGNPDPQKAFEAEKQAFDLVSCLNHRGKSGSCKDLQQSWCRRGVWWQSPPFPPFLTWKKLTRGQTLASNGIVLGVAILHHRFCLWHNHANCMFQCS